MLGVGAWGLAGTRGASDGARGGRRPVPAAAPRSSDGPRLRSSLELPRGRAPCVPVNRSLRRLAAPRLRSRRLLLLLLLPPLRNLLAVPIRRMDSKTYRQLGLDLGMGEDASGMAPEWAEARAAGNALVDWESIASDHDPYEVSPEGRERDAIAPAGEIIHHADYRSDAYPGTTRDFWVYVPSMGYVPSTVDGENEEEAQRRHPSLFLQ